MLDHISVSQIGTYLGCPLKYQRQYIEGRPFPFRPSGLAFGIAIHSALEWYHKQEKQGLKVTAEQVSRIFKADWQGQRFDNILFKSGETEQKLLHLGQRIIEVYLKVPLPGATEAVETDFSVPLMDPVSEETLEIPLVGRFDRVEQGPTIVDIKTAKLKIKQADADSSLQLTAYAYAYWKMYNMEPNLRLDVLMKAVNPTLFRLSTRRSQHHFRTLFLQAKYVLSGIKHNVFYANPSWRCTDCEFKSYCWYWNGKYESLPQAA